MCVRHAAFMNIMVQDDKQEQYQLRGVCRRLECQQNAIQMNLDAIPDVRLAEYRLNFQRKAIHRGSPVHHSIRSQSGINVITVHHEAGERKHTGPQRLGSTIHGTRIALLNTT